MDDDSGMSQIIPKLNADAEGLRRRLAMNREPLTRFFSTESTIRGLQPLYEIFWHASALGAEGEVILRIAAASCKQTLGGDNLAKTLLRMMLVPKTPGQRLMCDEWGSLLEMALHDGTAPGDFVAFHRREDLRLCIKYARNWRRWGNLITTLPPKN